MNVLIVGAGYIGSEVACHWTKMHHRITVTTSRSKRLEEISDCSQKYILLDSANEESVFPLISQNEVILVVPPTDSLESYLRLAHTIKQIAINYPSPRYLIYISTTNLYGDHRGLWVNERSELKAQDEKSRLLIELESMFQSLEAANWRVCILRLAEIYDSGREKLPSGFPRGHINMVHRKDVMSALDFVLQHRLTGIFNLADDEHLHAKEPYTSLLQGKNIKKISRVSNIKIKKEGFKFHHLKRVFAE